MKTDLQPELDWTELLRLARQRVRQRLPELDEDSQHDLAQESLTQLILYRQEHEVDNPGGLLTQIVVARCTDHIRRKKYRTTDIDEIQEFLPDDRHQPAEDGSESLEMATLMIYEVYRTHEQARPSRKNAGVPCSELVVALRKGQSWLELESEVHVAANTLAQRWKRCRDKFMALAERHGLKPRFLALADVALEGGD